VEEAGGCQFPEGISEYTLVWSDEFEGSSLDTTKWGFDLGDGCQLGPNLCGWGNNELQYYTSRPENVYVDQGSLVIRAVKEQPLYLNQYPYTSARLQTKNKGDWKYGRMDVRARIPTGRGVWSAIWMLPTDNAYGIWPKSGEIDIMENIGSEPEEILGTIHYGHDFWRFNSQYYKRKIGDEYVDFHEDYHVYTVLWNERCILFQVDGEDIGVPNTPSTVLPTTYPFDQRFHMILNIAVGGNLPGNPDGSAQFPQTMEVDYVRVYQ
jgi:beta-glucanase (GH16 family)